jgi:hypothetical protein
VTTDRHDDAPDAVSLLGTLLRHYGDLQLREQRAQTDARLATLKEERTRRQLAFRLGSTLIGALKRPKRFVLLPLDLWRAVRAFRADQRAGLLDSPAPPPDALEFRAAAVVFALRARWQSVVLPESGGRLVLTALAQPSLGPVVITLSADDDTTRAALGALAGAVASETEPGAVNLALPVGVPVVLLTEAAPRTRLRLRGAGDRAAVLCGAVEHDGASSSPAASTVGGDEPAPLHNAIVWQAAQMAEEGAVDRGIAFARRHARDFVRPAVSLLEANRDLADDARWLAHVNDYLRGFDLAPLRLRDGPGPRFARLAAEPRPAVEQGPLVSVIMPAHQAEAWVRLAAGSILAQTWRPLELIVVDDASSDGTWEALRALAAADARVRLLRNPVNVGPYVSKNLALSIARGAYITGHDADDWAHPQRIERHMHEVLASQGRLQASMTRMLRLDENGRFVHFAREGKASDDGALRDAAITCLFDARVLRERLGHWDAVRFGADSELIGRAQLVCGAGFARLRQLAMLCLDSDASLTNDPVHGVSKQHGVSPTRAFYRDQWQRWHRGLAARDAYLPFPPEPRPFEVPDAARVDAAVLARVIGGLPARSG